MTTDEPSRTQPSTDRQAAADGRAVEDNLRQIAENLAGTANPLRALLLHRAELRGMVGADGAAVCCGGRCIAVGATPGAVPIRDLAAWIAAASPAPVFLTDAIGAAYPAAAAWDAELYGVLARILCREPPAAVVCFRGPGGAKPRATAGRQCRSRSWGAVPVGTMRRLDEPLLRHLGPLPVLVRRFAEGVAELASAPLDSGDLLAAHLDALSDHAVFAIVTDGDGKVRIVTVNPAMPGGFALDGGDWAGRDLAELLAAAGLPAAIAALGDGSPVDRPRRFEAKAADGERRVLAVRRRRLVEIADGDQLRHWSALVFEDATVAPAPRGPRSLRGGPE